MKLTIDFETRSRVNIKKAGAWRYAEDASTEPMCLALKPDNDIPVIYAPTPKRAWLQVGHGLPLIGPDRLEWYIRTAEVIEAHNAEFERAIWHHCMHKRSAFPDLPFEKMRCSAARAAMCSLPRSLGQACEVLGLPVKKDMDGKRIMLRFCKPQKRRASKVKGPDGKQVYEEYWYEDPTAFVKLCQYCIQDVEAEHALSNVLPHLPDGELAIWRLDQIMNQRGVPVDLESVQALMGQLSIEEGVLLAEWRELTGGKVASPRQVEATLNYLEQEFGVQLDDLRKNTVEEALEGDD